MDAHVEPTMSPGEFVIEQIRSALRPFASVKLKRDISDEWKKSVDAFGVQVLYSKQNPHEVLFGGVTHDDIQWSVAVDFRAFSRAYFEKVIRGVHNAVREERRKRRGKGPIVLLDELQPEELIALN